MAKGFLDGYQTYDTSGGLGNPGKWRNAFHKRMSESDARQILSRAEQSPYEVLGVSPTASTSEIKKAFRQ